MRPAPVLHASLIAAVVAGLVMSALHLLAGEPLVDRAIALEAAARPAEDHGQELFSRHTQKVGLVAGGVVYGLAVGLIFGGVYLLAGRRLPGRTPRRRALVLAGTALWTLYLAPFLKYPANPPGVGEAATIYDRQTLYLLFTALAAGGLAVAALLARSLRAGGVGARAAVPTAVGVYALYVAGLWLAMPDNPDRGNVPTSLLLEFRTVSLAGAVLFWAVFALVFAAVLERAAPSRQPVDGLPSN
jgi:predicted cobalt transporter CbtA